MPTYELTCKDCGVRFDRFVMRLLRDEDRRCPGCGSTDVRQGVGGGFLGGRATSGDRHTGCGPGAFT